MFYLYSQILKTMALYSASDFTGYSNSYAVPNGSSDVVFRGPVDLTLPTGITHQVFDTLRIYCYEMYQLHGTTKAL